ncbi:MAG: selenide, water dikinase SelD [Acetobacteraceae bacterium]|nr:selenide, water dikinase SelD [Acetobacteraceae bacterium]
MKRSLGMADNEIRLTSLAHGGGCGCKLAPSVLQHILTKMPAAVTYANLLVGTETGDDAAVWRLNDSQAVVATTDFFTPIVDDPFDFGRIAATNAMSDVYAMGATPIMALAIVGIPVGKIAIESVQEILAGGAAAAEQAGIPVAGGHSIDSPEPIYGLAVLGLVHPERVLRNSGGEPGDALILTKGIGVGIYSAALKRGELSAPLYREMIASTTQLNAVGRTLADLPGVHAVTDVTGFGLLGHTLEIARGSGLVATLRLPDVPFLPEVEALAAQGFGTGAATRNWASYGAEVRLPPDLPDWRRGLLCDPQTSGGLLIACAVEAVPDLLERLHDAGFSRAREIGRLSDGGTPGVDVTT